MPVLLQPLLQENDHEHGGHDKIQPLGAEGDEGTEDPAQSRAREPVQVVQKGHKEHKPAPVHVRRNLRGIIDGKGLVAHAEDEVDLFQPHAAETVQHGNAVEQVPRVEHERHRQRLDGMKGSQQKVDRHKFHRAREDGQAHQAGIPEAEAGNIHIDAVGHP